MRETAGALGRSVRVATAGPPERDPTARTACRPSLRAERRAAGERTRVRAREESLDPRDMMFAVLAS